jgi:hypothetical protein
MSEVGTDEVILRVRRRAFQGGSKLLVVAGSLFLVMLTVVNMANVMGPGIGSIPLLAFSIFTGIVLGAAILAEIHTMLPQVIIPRTDGITCLVERNKRIDIPWGPKVHVDVIPDDRLERNPIGPMAGLGFYVPDDVGIVVHVEDGWNIDDVWRMFRSSLGIIKEKGLRMDEDMVAYIRYLRDREPAR